MFWRLDAWALAALLAAAMVAAWSAGFGWGRRVRIRGGSFEWRPIDDGCVVLLTLLLAFTFAMALGKHEQRRAALVADTNAIGDFYTCVSLLPGQLRVPIQDLIREYTSLRLEVSSRPLHQIDLEKPLQRIRQIQEEATVLVGEGVRVSSFLAEPLVDTLNGVTSSHAARLAAAKDRLPPSVVIALILAAAALSARIGVQQGAEGRTQVPGLCLFVFLVTLVVYVTMDLDQPARGWIRVSQEPMERLLSSMTQ